MRRFLSYFLSLVMFFSSFSIGTIQAKAEGEHQFSVQAYDWNAFDNDWEGSGTGEEITANSNVQPGQIFQVAFYYVPGADPEISMQVGLKYDNTLVEPMYYDGELYVETDMSTTYQGGIWPAAGTTPSAKKQTNWQVLYHDYAAGSQINLLVQDNMNAKPLETEGVLAWVYFKVKDSATDGSKINFEYNDEYTTLNLDRPKVTSGLSLNVYEELSSTTTLNTLSVTNGTTSYTLRPEFVPDSETSKDYVAIVPNQITDVTIDATPTDGGATVASGLGNHSLNVGDNEVSLIVQAADGSTDTYTVNVYRLNNDATLNSLSLTNDVDIGTFKPDITSYTALVPYKTSSTVVSASQTDENATIVSGTGTWSLSNYGDTKNTNEIKVNAENCKEGYASVPGNSCTSKTYKIEITRTAPSSNTNLSSLTIDGETVEGFTQGLYSYDIGNVPYEKSSVNVNAEVEDTGKATITSTLGTTNLSVGDNTIEVVVKAEDGTEQPYTIKVRRLSNNNKLASLTVTSNPQGTLSPAFIGSTDSYTYTAPATVEKVTIAATVEDVENATIISGPGEYDIDETNEVGILVQAEDGTQKTYTVTLVRTKSDNAYLKSLGIDGYTLNETFNKEKTSYTANVSGEVTKVNISAEVEDTGKASIVSGTGEKSLSVGNNTVEVLVKAENGTTTKTYTITINRAKKTISALSDLKVDGVTIDGFEEGTKEYTLPTVAFEKSKIKVEATPKDPDSTVTGTGDIDLDTGDNEIYVTVTAQDGVTQTKYTIYVERKKDSNANLKDLQIDGVTIEDFAADTLSYGVTVKNEVTSLNLNAIPESDSAEVTITGNKDFVTTEENTVKVTVTAQDGTMQIYKIYVTREKSDNNYLKSISLSSGVLSPSFKKDINDYTVDVERNVTTMTITAEVEDTASEYEVSGPSTLSIGQNTFKIIVTSENGKDNTYIITVNRKQSDNNYLSELKIDGVLVDGFDKETDSYRVTVEGTTTSVVLSGTTEEVHATVSGLGEKKLQTGENPFDIVVTAEDGTPRTYSLVIVKPKSNNSALSSLSITQTPISPSFNSGTYSYTASVDYNITNIDIVAVASDSNATITGDGNKELQTGENTFDIIVTSEGETTSKYTIVVTRAKNNNANLNNITLSDGYELNEEFESDVTSYSVSVPNEVEKLTITTYTQDPNAAGVKGDGEVNLKTGDNPIKITVTAEDGVTTKNYIVTITRAKSSDATLKSLSVNGGTLTPDFEPEVTEYAVTVPYEIDQFVANAETTSTEASISFDDDNSLSVGTETKDITVTAEDGTIKVYQISVTRQPSADNYLSSLSVKDVNGAEYIANFEKMTTSYDITVENNIDKLNISAELSDAASSITGTGDVSVDLGNNTFDVIVTSASGVDRTYKINVFRKSNSNNYLSSLSVKEGTISPNFDKETTSYILDIGSDVSKINIEATPEVESATVSGTGEFDVVVGPNTFEVIVTAQDLSTKKYVIVVNREASSNNYLSSLTVTPGEITPEFNKETIEYSMSVENSTKTITINATAEHSGATITGDGTKSLDVGEQSFDIVVTAEDKSTKTYTITVTRAKSSVKDLKTLTVDGVLVEGFDKNELTYSMHVDNSVKSVIIAAEVVDDTSSVSGVGEITLATGNNEIPVTVTAEDGSVKVYTINIDRAKSSNNYLSGLSIEEGVYTPDFDKETLTYNITVPYDVTALSLNAIKEDEAASIEIEGNEDFEVGANQVKINVTAENDDVRTYIINVTRQKQADNYLTSIVVTGNDGVNYSLSPDFDKETYSYEVKIPTSVTDVEVKVEQQNNLNKVTGDGKVSIASLPQTQVIKVLTEEGLERTYTLNFVKGLSNNKNLLSLSVDKGILTPSFNPEVIDYTVNLDSSATEITISADKSEESQTVTGFGTKSLKSGKNVAEVTVTAEDGSIRTYTIVINVAFKDVENGLTSLTVDKGTLSPEFNPETRLYTVDLDESQTNITISATGPNSITGTGLHNLDLGANVFEVISTNNVGDENVYRVVVNRGSVVSPYLKYLAIDKHKINEAFNKETYGYTSTISGSVTSLDVIAIPEDKNANVTITGSTNMVAGANTITILVTDEAQNSKTYNIIVTIGNNKITSDIHTVGDTYISTIHENKTVSEIKSKMTNPKDYLKIYSVDGTELGDNEIVSTGCVIKLVINGTENDSKILVIKGDINGDGEVGVADIIKIRLHILETTLLTNVEKEAADTNIDTDIGVADLIQIRSHILGNSNLYSAEVE